MYILLALNIIGFALMFYKFYELSQEKKKSNSTSDTLANDLSVSNKTKDSNALLLADLEFIL